MPVVVWGTGDNMKIIGRLGDLIVYSTEVPGPSSYESGGSSLTISGVSEIVEVISVSISGGYYAPTAEASASGNSVKVKVYEFNYPATAAGVAEEVAAGTDLSGETVKIVFLGK